MLTLRMLEVTPQPNYKMDLCNIGKEYLNHAITGYPEFDVAKKWVEIIGKECGDEILELK